MNVDAELWADGEGVLRSRAAAGHLGAAVAIPPHRAAAGEVCLRHAAFAFQIH
ncbi:Protein of unknown function [Gryllus bimaculatus]|nr:Protein of unknown function [Gryllus bimaculatus]